MFWKKITIVQLAVTFSHCGDYLSLLLFHFLGQSFEMCYNTMSSMH